MQVGRGLEAGTAAQTHRPATAVMELDWVDAVDLGSLVDDLQLPAFYCVE